MSCFNCEHGSIFHFGYIGMKGGCLPPESCCDCLGYNFVPTDDGGMTPLIKQEEIKEIKKYGRN